MDHENEKLFDLSNLINQIGTVSFFKNMKVSALKDIVFSGQIHNYPANSNIFMEAERAAGMHVLLRGQVHLCRVGLQGIVYIIHIIKPVIMFNEATVIDNKPNPVTAIANTDCTTWRISPENYQKLLTHYPEVGIGLLKILADRNRVLLSRYEDIMSRPVLARTAKLIYGISQNGKYPINRRDHPNQRIAAMAGTVPEAISRSIKILKENGVIEVSRSQIKILSTDLLINFALVEPTILKYGNHP